MCWKTSNWVSNVLTLWCRSGFRARSPTPGEPLRTMTGDFSANAPATLLAHDSPPTQYVTQTQPRPRTRA